MPRMRTPCGVWRVEPHVYWLPGGRRVERLHVLNNGFPAGEVAATSTDPAVAAAQVTAGLLALHVPIADLQETR